MSISSEEKSISETHALVPTLTEFREAFWGDGGVDILLQNAKQANNSSKELEGFVRDRAKAEEQIGKDLQKTARHNAQVGQHIGSFAPAWMELVYACSDKLGSAHISLGTQLYDLAKEISTYHNHQKEQYRLTKDQAVNPCSEALAALEHCTSHALKCKAAYHHAHSQYCEAAETLSKCNRETLKQKELEKLESRAKKLDSHCSQAETDYKTSLQKQESARQDFRDKMIVMADRLQRTESEHLQQMKKFVAKMLSIERKMDSTVEFVKKHQEKEEALSAELMIQQFMAVRGSNATLAPALRFEAPPTERPAPATNSIPTTQSMGSVSPDPSVLTTSESIRSEKGDKADKKKWLRKKRKKESRKDKGEKEGGEPSAQQAISERKDDANVDEEGYSIRPDNADRVGSKEDRDSDFSYGSDSDEGAATETKLRSISIKPIDEARSKSLTGNSSDLTAAVQGLSILKPPNSKTTTPLASEPQSRSSPTPATRNFLDDDIGGGVPAIAPLASTMLEPLGVLNAAPVSSGSSTPPTTTKDPSSSSIIKPLPPVAVVQSASPSRFGNDSPGTESPVTSGDRRMSSASASSSSTGGAAISPHGTGVQVYALLSETVNALFKGTNVASTLVKVTGELQLSFPSSSLSHITPLSPPLVIRLHPTSSVEQAHANTHLLETDSSSPSGDACYRFKMGALQAFLKTQHESSPTSAFFKVDVFKYQAKVNSAAELPIHFSCQYMSEETVANLKVSYAYNPQCRLNPTPIKFVSFMTPTEGVSNVQSTGPSQWANDRLVWKIPEIPAGTSSSLLAKMDLKSGPGRPTPVAVQFALDGQCLSGLSMDIASSAYQLAMLKHRIATGRYMAEA